MGSRGWPQMQCDNPRANKWGRSNLVHVVEEKTTKTKGMNRWENNLVPTPGPTQDFKCA